MPTTEKTSWNCCGEDGGVFIAFLPLLALAMATFLTVVAITIKAQNRTAETFRFDACAREITAGREKLLRKLVTTNQLMRKLQLAVYAARGMKIVPGMGVAAQLGEAAALTALRQTERAQEALLLWATATELPKFSCSGTAYSRTAAGCSFPRIRRAQFERETTAFPDVPGRIRLRDERKMLLAARCGPGKEALLSTVRLIGDPLLTGDDFHHVYQ